MDVIKFLSLDMYTEENDEFDGLNGTILNCCINGAPNKFESYDGVNLMSFEVYDIKDLSTEPYTIYIYYAKDVLAFICETMEQIKNLEKSFDLEFIKNNTFEKILFNFFDKLIKEDTSELEKLEEEITDIEDDLLTSEIKDVITDIIGMRKRLLTLKRYYEQLNSIFEGLIENENEFISKKEMRYFRILDNRIDRLFATVINLRDYTTQVREAYQAQMDNKTNNLMKTFTVITAIFSPLTLIVGWYGMNLKMPEFEWAFGYPFVILLSVGIVTLCIFWFWKNKWF